MGWLFRGDNRGEWPLWEQPAFQLYMPVMNSMCVGTGIFKEAGL